MCFLKTRGLLKTPSKFKDLETAAKTIIQYLGARALTTRI